MMNEWLEEHMMYVGNAFLWFQSHLRRLSCSAVANMCHRLHRQGHTSAAHVVPSDVRALWVCAPPLVSVNSRHQCPVQGPRTDSPVTCHTRTGLTDPWRVTGSTECTEYHVHPNCSSKTHKILKLIVRAGAQKVLRSDIQTWIPLLFSVLTTGCWLGCAQWIRYLWGKSNRFVSVLSIQNNILKYFTFLHFKYF